MTLLYENIKLALSAIRVNKMRSFLTMLGMIIGISSVIAVVSIGDTMRNIMSDQYASIGLNRAIVYMQYMEDMRISDYFSYDDIEKIKEIFGDRLAYIDFQAYENSTVTKGRNQYKVNLQGAQGGYDKVQNIEIVYGRMINETDVEQNKFHIVIEDKSALKFFGTENAVGKKLRATVKGQQEDLLIVGIYHTPDSILNAVMGSNNNDTFYVPETMITYPDMINYSINLYTADGINQELFKKQFTEYIARERNREPHQVIYYAVKDEMKSMDSILGGMSAAVGAIAAISLLVGGIGIMNIMLVSVTERTREIGIRKALGARTKDVLVQFLVESAIISAAGGIVGTMLGVGVVVAGGTLLGIGVVVKPSVIFIAVAFSAVVGIFFGLYPASKAAKADPIIALRYE